jgi:prepilin-type N-terminal cleavage/methylation domain-containing protein
MKQDNRMKKQQGFTLIELVVVIAILAILAAFALPRFAQLSEQAHRSSIQGTAGALSAGVALTKAQWVGNGADTSPAGRENLDGFGDGNLDVSEKGWPISTTGYLATGTTPVMNATRCQQIWEGVMQSNAPTIGANADYSASGTGSECTFTYQLDGLGSTIIYDTNNGEITKTVN